MARYQYKALGTGGEVLTGVVAAVDKHAAIDRLRAMQIVPLQVEVETRRLGSALPGKIFARKTPNEKDLMLFTRELGILLSAGISLDRALAKLDGLIVSGPAQGLAGAILRALRGGSSLGDALETRSDIFPAYYVGMIRAGEAGGSLVPVLERLSVMLEKSQALKARLRSALTYPILVLLLTGLSLIVLLVYVVPEFRPMFEDSAVELPLATRIVVAFSDFVAEWGWLVLAGLLGVLVLLRGHQRSATGRRQLDATKLRLPLFGDLLRRIETARFCRSLGTLRANGVALTEAVGIAADTLSNRTIAAAAHQVVGPLEKGEGLSTPLRNSGQFPELALQLLEVGEESGRLHEMLLQIADIYDTEVEHSIQRMLAVLSPAVTIFLGCLIAFIIGSILAAILGSYEMAL